MPFVDYLVYYMRLLLSLIAFFTVHDNALTGKIPAEVGQLQSLSILVASNNRLTGGLPSHIGLLSNLRTLELDGNRLTGGITSQLQYVTFLGEFRSASFDEPACVASKGLTNLLSPCELFKTLYA